MLGRRFVIPLIVIGSVAVGGVAGAVLGVPSLSGAANGTTTSPARVRVASGGTKGALRGARGDRFEAAAKALNLTPQQLRDKLSDGKTTIADVAKQQNVPINDVIDAIAAADRKAIEDWVNKPLPHPFGGMPGANGQPGASANGGAAPNGKVGGGFGRPFAGAMGGLDEVAKALHTTPQQLIQDLASGKSVKDIATANGVNINDVIDAAVKAGSDRIDKAESAGKLTPEQAAKAKTALRDAITKFVNGEMPFFGGKGGFHLPKMGGGSGTP